MAKELNQKHKHKRTKRGGRKRNHKSENFVIYSSNAAGLKFKLESLKNVVKNVNAAVFTVQETHFVKKGKFRMENYETFEAIRKKWNGGTLIGAHKSLKPVLISEYCEEFELLTIEVCVGKRQIRIISGYGPQETWPETQRIPFFIALEEEVSKAELMGKSIIIEMDSNSKLGKEIIPRDPHNQTPNGLLLAGIINRHGLIVGNGLADKCEGIITRRRETIDGTEESVIDHLLFSEDLRDELNLLVIDEFKTNALTKIVKTKSGIKTSESDHNALISYFNIAWDTKVKAERVEMFNLKNSDGQMKFKEFTSEKGGFSDIFQSNDDLDIATEKFFRKLNDCIYKSFDKIRITERQNREIEELFDKRKILRGKNDESSRIELKEVELKLAEKCAETNYMKIKEEIGKMDCEEGGVNSGFLWKLKKKLSPKCRDPPTAMLDTWGNLVTDTKQIQNLALSTFTERLKNREIKTEFAYMKLLKEKLFEIRIKSSGRIKTPPWSMNELDNVLKNLKKNKSRDPMGYANEIFSPSIAGLDFRLAILNLMNRIKAEQKYPEVLEMCNISSIYKNRGSRNSFENYRGIFRVSILRTILDRLIYNDEYSIIDSQLTDSNVGARKNRNVRDNVFVLNAIMNSVINGNEKPIDIQIFDVEKCFDALWLKECINDLHESGLTNDKLPLLYLENKNAKIAVKSSSGITDRKNISDIVMQGTVFGSLLCTTSMDKLGKLMYSKDKLLYKYKGKVDTPSLGMVDDILSINECSEKAVEANAKINTFIEYKKLKLSESKCSRIHISSKKGNELECPQLKVHEKDMKTTDKEKYLGDIVHTSGKVKHTIEDRKNRAIAISAEILAIINDIPLGKYRLEIGLKLRQAMFINGILFNSEAWHAVNQTDIKTLETIDEHLLRSLVKGHSKTPLEFLYLEAGALPIRFLMSSRRMIYFQTILKRDENELVKKILKAQMENPSSGDFIEHIKSDFEMIGQEININEIEQASIGSYKKFIKNQIRKAALKHLNEMKEKHTKISHIKYEKLETQKYFTSEIFNDEEVNLLFALRSRTVDCKGNFKSKYKDSNLTCQYCKTHEDDQPHMLNCESMRKSLKSTEVIEGKYEYEDIFKDVWKQKIITQVFKKVIEIREQFKDQTEPGAPDLCTVPVLVNSADLHSCIDGYLSRK